MKIISRIVLLGVFIYVLFLYRNELSGIVGSIAISSNKSTIENTSWAGLRKKAYDAYEFKDTQVAITILEEYLATVHQELQKHYSNADELSTSRHDIECELSVVHNKLRNKYYQLGDTDKHYEHEMQYREYLALCTNPDEDET